MSETVTIPKEEYNALVNYKRIFELEHDRPLSKELLKKLEAAPKDIRSGKGTVLHSKEEVVKYFDSL